MGKKEEKNEIGFSDKQSLALTSLMHGVGIAESLAKDLFLAYQMVVGTRYNGGADTILEELNPGEKVSLLRESDNPYDKRAIMVIDEDERKIGYIPRQHNAVLSSLMDAGKYIYGIVAEPREGNLPPSQGGAVWIKLYMREYSMPGDLSVIPRQGANGSFAVVKLWTKADENGKESLDGISAIKVINGEEKGLFHNALSEIGEDDDMLAIAGDSQSLIKSFYEFAGFLPLVGYDWPKEALDSLKEGYGVLLGKPFSNFIVDTLDMSRQHYWYRSYEDIDAMLDTAKVPEKNYAGELVSCRKILALYRQLEEVERRQEKAKMSYDEAKKRIAQGTYKDTRGRRYEVLGVAKPVDNAAPAVVYKSLNNKESGLLSCTAEYFLGSSPSGRGESKRFVRVSDEEAPYMKERLLNSLLEKLRLDECIVEELRRVGIVTVRDLVRLSESEVKNLGFLTLEEKSTILNDFKNKYALAFRPEGVSGHLYLYPEDIVEIARKKELTWEYRLLFSAVMHEMDCLESYRSKRPTLKEGSNDEYKIDSAAKVVGLLQDVVQKLRQISNDFSRCMNQGVNMAFGKAREEGDEHEIIVQAKRLAEIYKGIIAWRLSFEEMQAEGKYAWAIDNIVKVINSYLENFDTLYDRLADGMEQLNDLMERMSLLPWPFQDFRYSIKGTLGSPSSGHLLKHRVPSKSTAIV